MYLLRNSAHPRHYTKAIPFGLATRVRRNCSTNEKYDQRSDEYQTYLVERGYNPSEVSKQFEKAKPLPREDLSPIYNAETFWHGSDEKSTRTKKIGSARIDFVV